MKTLITPLLAGAASIDITPPSGVQLAGDIGRERHSTGVLDPLFARALVLRQGKRTLCILSLDLAQVRTAYSTPLRRQIARLLNTTPDAVMIHAMQSHSAPSLARDNNAFFPDEPDWLHGAAEEYIEKTLEKCVVATQRALKQLQPVTLEAGRTNEGRVAFNRRFIHRDGTAQMHPGVDDTTVLCCEGPMDPELSVSVFRNHRKQAVAALLHHTCHPTHGFAGTLTSADWPGLWATGVEKQLGRPCVALVINGALGDLHHRDHMNRTHVDTMESMTAKLMETTGVILSRMMKPVAVTPLAWQTCKLPLTIRRFPADVLRAERALLKEYPAPKWTPNGTIEWDWMFAAWHVDRDNQRRKQPTHAYEIQVFRIGDLALVGWPDEPFVEAQLALKMKPVTDLILVAHQANNGWSYLPSRAAYKRGGYEVRNCAYAAGSLEKIQRETQAVLRRLFAGK